MAKAGLAHKFKRAMARPLQHVDLGRAKVNLGHEGISELSQKRYIEDSTSDSGFHAYLVDDVVSTLLRRVSDRANEFGRNVDRLSTSIEH